MTPLPSFARLFRTADYRVKRLQRIATASLALADAAERDKLLAHVVIETQSLWSNFVRAYLLSCLMTPKRISGARVTVGNLAITSPGTLLHEAAKVAKGPHAAAPVDRRDEPSWHDVNIFIRTCAAMQVSHLAQVQSVMSAGQRGFYDLPCFRNFYAHRNEATAKKAVQLALTNYVISGKKHPSEVLCANAPKQRQPLILDWLDDLRVTLELLCD